MLDTLLSAAQPLLVPWFTLWSSPVTGVEVLGFVLSVAMVWCNQRLNPLGWPLSIASSALYALLFAHSRLLGEASLQLFFIAMAGWGWWCWLRGRDAQGAALQVTRLSWRERAQWAGATLLAWPLLALGLQHIAGGDLPWLDALPTVGSVAGTLLLARKKLDNWAVWVAVNVLSVALFAMKGLWLTVLLYSLFTAMAVVGWRAWARLARA